MGADFFPTLGEVDFDLPGLFFGKNRSVQDFKSRNPPTFHPTWQQGGRGAWGVFKGSNFTSTRIPIEESSLLEQDRQETWEDVCLSKEPEVTCANSP